MGPSRSNHLETSLADLRIKFLMILGHQLGIMEFYSTGILTSQIDFLSRNNFLQYLMED
jgi:hypothetical protein